jgi:hypothetical protein
MPYGSVSSTYVIYVSPSFFSQFRTSTLMSYRDACTSVVLYLDYKDYRALTVEPLDERIH